MNNPAVLDRESVIEELPVADWQGSFDAALRARALGALESGLVLYLPRLAFRIEPEEAPFLSADAAGGARKNISLDPATGRTGNTALQPEQAARLTVMIDRFGRAATSLVAALFPGYAPHLERARTSFRPVEIAGRATSPRHDDRLLHVDAFPTRPMRGRRILRLFSNIAPDGAPREWRVGQPFPEFARTFLPRARAPLPGTAWLNALLGLTKGRRSAYDELMLGLHDAAKLDAAWQAATPRADVSFPSDSTWLCFTDQVLHAALAGHCALEQTFHLPVDAMEKPDLSPLRVLERSTGRALV